MTNLYAPSDSCLPVGDDLPVAPMAKMLHAVADDFQTSPAEIRGNCRSGAIIPARFAFAWLARRNGKTFAEIGRFLGRDHTTISNAFSGAERYRNDSQSFKKRTDRLSSKKYGYESA